MQNLAELEQRINIALERIGRGLDSLAGQAAEQAVAVAAAPEPVVDQGEVTRLRAELEAERAAHAQAQERLRAIKERDLAQSSQGQEKVERLTRQLDVQGLELQRMRRTTVSLREQLRQLREAVAAGLAEPHLINKAMLTELEALRASRLTEMAELDEIASALDQHLTEAENA